MSVKTFGMVAFRGAIENGMELAASAGEYVQESSSLELLTRVSLSVVCFRFNPEYADHDEETLEAVNKKVLARVFWEDRAFISSTLLRKTFSLRLCIVNHTTTWPDLQETLETVERFGGEASSEALAS